MDEEECLNGVTALSVGDEANIEIKQASIKAQSTTETIEKGGIKANADVINIFVCNDPVSPSAISSRGDSGQADRAQVSQNGVDASDKMKDKPKSQLQEKIRDASPRRPSNETFSDRDSNLSVNARLLADAHTESYSPSRHVTKKRIKVISLFFFFVVVVVSVICGVHFSQKKKDRDKLDKAVPTQQPRTYSSTTELASTKGHPAKFATKEWTQFNAWSECSVSCGKGIRQRNRSCVGGTAGEDCIGKSSQNVECDKSPCKEWTQFNVWSECSVSCGKGIRQRTRSCVGGTTGVDCIGKSSQDKECQKSPCKGEHLATTYTPRQPRSSTSTSSTASTIQPLPPEQHVTKECEANEFRYNDNCYWLVVYEQAVVDFAQAEAICKKKLSIPAYPVDRNHYEIMAAAIKRNIPEYWKGSWIWLGLYQNPTTGNVTLSDRRTEAPYLKWAKKEPSRKSSDVNIAMIVYIDSKNPYNGMWDDDPSTKWIGVICQY